MPDIDPSNLNPNTALTGALGLLVAAVTGWFGHRASTRVRQVDDSTALRKELWGEIYKLRVDLKDTDDELENCRRQHWQAERWVARLADELRVMGRDVELPDLALKDTPPIRIRRRVDAEKDPEGGTDM